ncbi:hypothetical protein BCR42DRAFT_405154 [Absidia repens]|uniref:Uncharacterized protein n=1 Tax=Absidia repens TaxID=90262 RepID=A0A1X2IYT3_9FUNG|nr:hypothetical protein BCR42DRAFT_405154 [Absidia repens]
MLISNITQHQPTRERCQPPQAFCSPPRCHQQTGYSNLKAFCQSVSFPSHCNIQ